MSPNNRHKRRLPLVYCQQRIEPGCRLALSRCEKRGLSERAAGTVGLEQKVFRDNEVKLQACSVETVEKVVKQRAKPV